MLQRFIRRGPSVVLVVTLTCGALAVLGYVLTRQISSLALELPAYRQTIRQKIADVRQSVRGGAVEQMQSTIDDIKREISGGPSKTSRRRRSWFRSPVSAWVCPNGSARY